MYTRNYRVQKGEAPRQVREEKRNDDDRELSENPDALCNQRENDETVAPASEKTAVFTQMPCCDEQKRTEPSETFEEKCWSESAETVKKCRFRATRLPKIEFAEPCEPVPPPCEDVKLPTCEKNEKSPPRSLISSLFSSLCADELLLLALVVLLILEGCDEVMILALCFILS